MSSRTLFAYDFSGSTARQARYHALTQEIYQKEVKVSGPPTILKWDAKAEVITEADLEKINATLRGGGGTKPSCVAKYISDQGFHGRFVLITDGQTSQHFVDLCTTILGMNWTFTTTEVHLINTGGVVNMSVSCPFTRNTPHIVYEYDQTSFKPIISVSAEDFEAVNLLKSISTLEAFEEKRESIERAVQARTMGTIGDPTIRDNLLAMKKRIVAARATENAKDQSVVDMIAAVQSSAPQALELAELVTGNYYANMNNDDWSAGIARLVGMCEGSLRGAYDLSNVNAAIQSDRARRAAEVMPAGVADIPQTEAVKKFICPVDLDKDGDLVLLIADGEPVLTGLDKAIINSVADCPLNALNYTEIIERIVKRLDHPVSLAGMQRAAAAGAPIEKSEVTERSVEGGITLGCSREQVQCATSTIARMVAGGKLLGNPDLWYAVIWRLVETDAVPYLAPLKEALQAQMKWRCENNTTFMSLSGLPELPTTKVPLGVAAWYVAAASAFTLSGKEEPMRAHIAHIEPLLAIVDLVGYALPPGISAHIQRLRTMLGMLRAVKTDRHSLPFIAKALYQNSIAIDPETILPAMLERESIPPFLPIDGPATEASAALAVRALPKPWQAVSQKELLAIASMVEPSFSAGDVIIPYDFAPVADRRWAAGAKVVSEWAYGLKAPTVVFVPICPATCRPYYTVDGGKLWMVAAEECYGFKAAALLSVNRYFGEFVFKYGQYPTQQELLVFCYNRIAKGSSGKSVLPFPVLELIQQTFDEFAEIVASVTPADFKKRFMGSVTIYDRQRIEKEGVQEDTQ